MRIAEIIGTVTLNQAHPQLKGGRFKLAVPLSLCNLTNHEQFETDPIVVFDELGANQGNRIMVSEGGEAALPFYPEMKPIDAYNAGILDEIHLHLPDEGS